MTSALEGFITVAQVTKMLGIGRTTVHSMVTNRQFVPVYRLSPNRVAFKLADVETWLESRREGV